MRYSSPIIFIQGSRLIAVVPGLYCTNSLGYRMCISNVRSKLIFQIRLQYLTFLQAQNLSDTLVYALLGFRNIFVCQMIYVMTWDFGFIAEIESCKGHVYQSAWQIASIFFAFRKVCSAFSPCSSCSNIFEYKA